MSASDVLSSDEMDTLLNEKGSKNRDPDQAAADGVPHNFYDFISEYHKSITKSRGFQVVNMTFAAELRERFNRILRKKIMIEVIEPEASTFEQYLENNNDQSTLNLIQVSPSNTFMLIMLDQHLLYSCIEILFGGKTERSNEIEREFGHVDLKLSKLLSHLVTDAIKNSFDTVLDINFEYIKTAKDHMMPNRINSTDKIIIMQYTVKIDDKSSRIDICFPHSVLNSASKLITNEDVNTLNVNEQAQWANSLKQNVNGANINISAEITETDIKLKDVMNLKVGDVISIDNPSIGYLLAEGVKVFKVKCGVHDGTKVVEIMERITD